MTIYLPANKVCIDYLSLYIYTTLYCNLPTPKYLCSYPHINVLLNILSPLISATSLFPLSSHLSFCPYPCTTYLSVYYTSTLLLLNFCSRAHPNAQIRNCLSLCLPTSLFSYLPIYLSLHADPSICMPIYYTYNCLPLNSYSCPFPSSSKRPTTCISLFIPTHVLVFYAF